MSGYFNNEKSRGVTIIELIVVLAVFFTVIAVVISIFTITIERQRKVLAEQDLINQISYVVEYISRQARLAVKDISGSCLGGAFIGYNYLLTNQDLQSGFYQGVKFLHKDGTCYEFFLDSDGILKEVKDSGNAQAVLSDKFEVSYARFVVDGDKGLEGSSSDQSRISFSLNILMPTSSGQQEKIFQTTVSRRNLEPFIQ